MDITFNCSKCGQTLTTDPSNVGLGVQCPACNTTVTVPHNATPIPQTQPQPESPRPAVSTGKAISSDGLDEWRRATNEEANQAQQPRPSPPSTPIPVATSQAKSFICNACGTNFTAKATGQATCPKCFSFDTLPFNIDRRSGWATFFRVMGGIGFALAALGVLFLLSEETDKRQSGIALISFGLVMGLQSFFAAFLLDVVTDIRWFLKKLTDRPPQPPEKEN